MCQVKKLEKYINPKKNYNKMKISEIMNKIVAVEDNLSLKEAAKIMSDKDIGSLIFLKDDEVAGIVTEKDIKDNVNNLGIKISSFKPAQVITIEQSESLEEAAEVMAKNKIKRLPVTDEGKLVGIITATDIICHSDEISEDFFFD
jgi:CBS domain-containing protein